MESGAIGYRRRQCFASRATSHDEAAGGEAFTGGEFGGGLVLTLGWREQSYRRSFSGDENLETRR